MMKNLVRCGVSALVATVSATVLAGTVRIDSSANVENGIRGANIATVLEGFAGIVDANGLGNSFDTFSLIRGNECTAGQTYDVTLDTVTRAGNDTDAKQGARTLSPRTAYLYTQFRSGKLGSGAWSNSDSAALQQAIWFLEGQSTQISPQARALVEQACAAGWTDIGDIRVMNLKTLSGSGTNPNEFSQSQLTMVPLPPGVWAGVSGFSGVALLAVRRRWTLRER